MREREVIGQLLWGLFFYSGCVVLRHSFMAHKSIPTEELQHSTVTLFPSGSGGVFKNKIP
jgi:hypothetical protein